MRQKIWALLLALTLALATAGAAFADIPPGQQGYQGQTGNQGSPGGNGN